MCNIIIVVPNDILGGAEQYLKNIAIYYAKNGCLVDVFFLKNKISNAWGSLEELGVNLFYTNNKRELTGIFGLFKNLLTNKKKHYKFMFTSHIHINSYMDLLRRFKFLNVENHIARESTSVFLRYNGVKLWAYKIQYLFSYKLIDLLICQSDLMYNQLIFNVPKLKNKSKVIPNLINLENNCSDVFRIDGSRYIVSAGRLIEEKGFDLLIEAFEKLTEHYDDLVLLILGEGNKRFELEQLILDKKLQRKVILKGFVENVYPYFKGAELCVVSSRIEGFPNVILQMMLSNTRVVSTLCAGGINELRGVVTCNANDIDSLFNSMFYSLNEESHNQNRIYFDIELQKRSIKNFVDTISSYVDKK